MRARIGFALLLTALLGATAGAGEPAPATTAGSQEESDHDPTTTESLFSAGHTLERSALIQAVLRRNRDLVAARHAVDAARARAGAADELPDARGSYGFAPLSPLDDEVRFGQKIEVGQELPWPGTLAKRGDRAEALAGSSEAELRSIQQELALTASRLFDRLWYLARALTINAEHQELMRDFSTVATTRYAAGLAPQQGPLAAEVQIAHLEHHQIVLETERQTVVARLNALLHRPPSDALPPPAADPAIDAATDQPSSAALAELARLQRPELAAIRATIDARSAAADLARLSGRPDFRPMASYSSMWNQEAHRWMVGVGVTLPIWRQRVQAQIAAAESELAAGHERLTALEDTIAAEVVSARTRLQESRHVVSLFESRLLPAAQDQVRAAESAFTTGQVDFLAVIDAERSLRDTQLGLAEARAQTQSRLAELKHAVGLRPGERWPATSPEQPAGGTTHPTAAEPVDADPALDPIPGEPASRRTQ